LAAAERVSRTTGRGRVLSFRLTRLFCSRLALLQYAHSRWPCTIKPFYSIRTGLVEIVAADCPDCGPGARIRGRQVLSYSPEDRAGRIIFLIGSRTRHLKNFLARIVFLNEVAVLLVRGRSGRAIERSTTRSIFFLEPLRGKVPLLSTNPWLKKRNCYPFWRRSRAVPRFEEFVNYSIPAVTRRVTMDFLVELNQRIQREIRYVIPPWSQECRLQGRRWNCAPVSWPRLGLAAVAGATPISGWRARLCFGAYLIQLRPDEKAAWKGPEGPDIGFHRPGTPWAEVYLPGAGWVRLDATSRPADGRRPHPRSRDARFRFFGPAAG